MVEQVEIKSGDARLVLAPSLGGGIARLDVDGKPLLRPWNGDEANPFSLACNPLVPFSNRISQGGFEWQGKSYQLEPNLPGEAFPIHGDGFQKSWIAEPFEHGCLLELDNGSYGPLRYRASQNFTLTENSLDVVLAVTNTASDVLPFGMGLHPWFPRDDKTKLCFEAKTVWEETSQHLPSAEYPVESRPAWDFSELKPLPADWINNAFVGWSGETSIEQGAEAVSCSIKASNSMSTAIVFSPSERADFFCFEPVSHPVDAFHLPNFPGLQSLEPGEKIEASFQFSWETK